MRERAPLICLCRSGHFAPVREKTAPRMLCSGKGRDGDSAGPTDDRQPRQAGDAGAWPDILCSFLCSLVPGQMLQCGAMADAACCEGKCNALRWPMQCTAFCGPLWQHRQRGFSRKAAHAAVPSLRRRRKGWEKGLFCELHLTKRQKRVKSVRYFTFFLVIMLRTANFVYA